MAVFGEATRVACLAAVVASACNGQFDFDTVLADAGGPPIIVTDGGMGDAPSTSDVPSDASRTGIHIACGAADCLSSGCCSTSTGIGCVDISEGGTCGGLLIQCDDTADCPEGQVCCAEIEDRVSAAGSADDAGDDRPVRVHCEPETHCRSLDYVILCDPDRPGPCTQCIASSLPGLPPGYHQCVATP